MNIKLFLKGILFYITFATCMLAAASIDSLCDKGYLVETIIIVAGLIYWCKKSITEEEFNTLSLDNFFKKNMNRNK